MPSPVTANEQNRAALPKPAEIEQIGRSGNPIGAVGGGAPGTATSAVTGASNTVTDRDGSRQMRGRLLPAQRLLLPEHTLASAPAFPANGPLSENGGDVALLQRARGPPRTKRK